MVRRLRIGRDGSLSGQSRGEPPERSNRSLLPADPTPQPTGDSAREEDTQGSLSTGEANLAEEQQEFEPDSAVELDYTGRPTEPIEVTSDVRRMQPTMRRCLQHYFDRPEQAPRRSNWGMLHAIMVYGVDTPILAGRQRYSAVAWIAGNNICRGKRLLRDGPSGIEAATGIGLQGHQAQALAVFALIGVPADYPLYAGRSKYSVEDLVQAEAAACRSGEELTFSLIGLSHYLDTDATWTGADGERWDFPRLIREELAQPIVGVTCGGTHRLMGFAHALRQRRIEGRPIEGQWLRAEMYIEDFVDYTYRLQNRDGSMSTNWFEGREDNGDLDRKVQTTGHMVEFLLTVTPDSELQNPKLIAAVQFLLDAMDNGRDHDWSIGPKGHALRSLAMYYQRVYDEGTPWQTRAATASRHSGRRR